MACAFYHARSLLQLVQMCGPCMEDLEVRVGSYFCHKKSKSPLCTCLSDCVFQNFPGSLYTEDLDPVTQLPVPKQILLSKGQRDQLAREHCGRQFHSEYEGRRPEFAETIIRPNSLSLEKMSCG